MCEPTTMAIASFAIAAGSTAMSYMGQQQAAAQQAAFQARNAQNANDALRDQYAATQQRIQQEREAAAMQKGEVARETRAAAATARTAAGEAGVTGLSVDALLADIYGQEGRYRSAVDQQTDWTTQQLQSEMRGQRATARSRIDSIPDPVRPNFFDAGLRIAGAGVDSWGKYKQWSR